MIKFVLRSAVATAALAAQKSIYDAVVPNILTTALIRVKNGIIYSIAGAGAPDRALAAADSIT